MYRFPMLSRKVVKTTAGLLRSIARDCAVAEIEDSKVVEDTSSLIGTNSPGNRQSVEHDINDAKKVVKIKYPRTIIPRY